jgi:hypothetical protein
VFHSPQEGHLPSHFGLSYPQELQNQTDLFFVPPIAIADNFNLVKDNIKAVQNQIKKAA